MIPDLAVVTTIPLSISRPSIASGTNKNCFACGELTSGAHSCSRCHCYINSYCRRLEGEEGFGSSVVCPGCDISAKKIPFDSMRAGIKRNQEKLHERMLNASSKRVKHAEIGDNILIPIAQPCIINSLGPRNILAYITEKGGSTYRVDSQGSLPIKYTRNQFDLCPVNLLTSESVPDTVIKLKQCKVFL